MTIAYTWTFNPLDVKLDEAGLNDVVYNVHWQLVAVDGEYSASTYGTCGLPPPQGTEFTSYPDLTEEQVKKWVFDAMGAEKVAFYEGNLANRIELQKNPVSASLPPPWSANA